MYKVIKNVSVPRVDEVILLGHYMSEDIYTFYAFKYVSGFNSQSYMLCVNFKHATWYIRIILLHKYCTAFYDS